MKKRYFLDRLCLFGFGCATTRAPYHPQPQLTPMQVTPRGELLFIVIIALVMISLIILLFKSNKPKRKKKKRSS